MAPSNTPHMKYAMTNTAGFRVMPATAVRPTQPMTMKVIRYKVSCWVRCSKYRDHGAAEMMKPNASKP
ncbi:hypothetical protein D3C85_1493240 [compost metagenome]